MLRSILVGLDGSAYSNSAVELGIRWAQHSQALLVGLGVIDEPTICKPEPTPIGGDAYKQPRDEYLMAEARRKVEQFLKSFAGQCEEAHVACKVLEDVGLPYEEILVEAQRFDLILLGQQSFFHFETQEGPGKTLHNILKNSPRPVVTVPEKLGGGNAVVIAYDGSLQAARTLQMFQVLGLDQSQKVHVVTVHADHVAAERHAERAVEFLRFHGIVAQPHTFGNSAPVAQVLLEQVRQLDAGLLVMGAYGHSAFREFFFGSVTRKVLKDSTVPLFLYH